MRDPARRPATSSTAATPPQFVSDRSTGGKSGPTSTAHLKLRSDRHHKVLGGYAFLQLLDGEGNGLETFADDGRVRRWPVGPDGQGPGQEVDIDAGADFVVPQ